MKVLQVHNRPRGGGGATAVFEHTVRLLRERGVETVLLTCDSARLSAGLRGRLRAFAAGIYSPGARRHAAAVIARDRPDCAHIHDLQPFLPSTLLACRDAGLPVVMTCHNYRLTCPVFSHVDGRGEPCERCLGGREYWCLLMNCRGDRFESAAFALHNLAARRLRLFSAGVDLFLVPSRFVKDHLARAGFSPESIEVLPHPLPIAETSRDAPAGEYLAYAGRLSPEKGLGTLLAAAALTPGIPIAIAGDGPLLPDLTARATPNVRFLGWLDPEALRDFYGRARAVVVPSRCCETFGVAAAEAMNLGIPVIASRIGALAELVGDGVSGLLFEPEDPRDLAARMHVLWTDQALGRRLGREARSRVRRLCDEADYLEKLLGFYSQAMRAKVVALGRAGSASPLGKGTGR
jgi:glycosyltransferase involved in cell wall biosynthesis